MAGLRKMFTWGEDNEHKIDIVFEYKTKKVVFYRYSPNFTQGDQISVLNDPDIHRIKDEVSFMLNSWLQEE